MLTVIMFLVGGVLGRCIGGGTPLGLLRYVKSSETCQKLAAFKLPWGIPRLLYGIPFALLLHSWLWILAYGLADIGKRTGHGQYLGFGEIPKQPDKNDETLDFIVRFFMGRDVAQGQMPSYWRCAVGMLVTGLAATLGGGLVVALGADPVLGILLALSGATKPLGYMLGWFIWRHFSGQTVYDGKTTSVHPNIYGEFFSVAVPWGIIAWAL